MLLIYQTEPPLEACLAEGNAAPPGCDGLVEKLVETGQYRAGGILQPTFSATSLQIRDGQRLITDGPFAETREQLAGYVLIEADDLDQALAVAAMHPVAQTGTVEVRPLQFIPNIELGVHEPADLLAKAL